jgi:hypothetical protein
LETIVDFGDMQVFEGATTYPAILIMQKDLPQRRGGAEGIHQHIAFIDALKVGDKPSLADVLTATRRQTSQSMLSNDGWQLEDKEIAQLRLKLMHTGKSLKAYCGSPYRGVLTGFNEAFVIDGAAKDKLIAQDAKSAELLKPFLEGKDLKPWHVEPRDLWLIFTRRGVDIEQYPAIKQHLEQYKERLTPKPKDWQGGKWGGRKTGSYQWHEIQDTVDYYQAFEASKIVYPNFFGNKSSFSQVNMGVYSNNKVYLIPNADDYVLGVLNSAVMWFVLSSMCTFKSGQYYDMHSIYVEKFPIPETSESERQSIAELAAAIQNLAEVRFKLEADFRYRIACDLGGRPTAKLNKKLHDWFTLDAVQFRKEVKKAFKTDIPLAERSDWEAYLQSQAQKVTDLNAQIKEKEAALNQYVYGLFQLNSKEIGLIEAV